MNAAVPLKRLFRGIGRAVAGIFPHKRLQHERMRYAENFVGLAFERTDHLVEKRLETDRHIVKRFRPFPRRNVRACPFEKATGGIVVALGSGRNGKRD
jgi:hypothetical protein